MRYRKFLIFIFFLLILFSGCQERKNNINPQQQQQFVDAFNESIETSLIDSDPDSALFLAKKVVGLSDKLDDDLLVIKAMNQVGVLYERKYQIDSANLMFTQSLNLAYSLNDTNNIAVILQLQANTFITDSKYESARKKLKEVMQINILLHDDDNLATNFSGLGECYYYEQQYDSSLFYFLKALCFFENTNNARKEATILNNISNVYGEKKLHNLSKTYLTRAIRINDSINNQYELGLNLNSLGLLFKNTGNYDSAVYYLSKYINLQQELNNTIDVIIGNYNLANTFIRMGNYGEAAQAMNRVYSFSTENDIVKGQVLSLMGLANIENINNNKVKASEHYKNALQLSKEMKNFEFQKDILFELGKLDVNESFNDTIDYLREYKMISDSLAKMQTTEKILELEAVYNMEKNKIEIALLQKTNQLKNNQIWLLLIASFLGILTTILIVISYRKRQSELRQNNLLAEEKNKTQQLLLVQTEKDNRIQADEKEKAILKLKLKEQEIIFNTLLYAKLVNVFHEVIDKLNSFYK